LLFQPTVQMLQCRVLLDRLAFYDQLRFLLYSSRPVTAVLSSWHKDKVSLLLERSDGSTESILTTLGHPFYVEGRGFVAAGELTAGVILSQHNENAAAVLHLTGRDNAPTRKLTVKSVKTTRSAIPWLAYNLSVKGDHAYFVGKSRAWVHNACKYKKRKSGQSGKESANDIPSWAAGKRPYATENGRKFAKRLCDEQFGEDNYPTGANSDYNKIKKYGDRAFE